MSQVERISDGRSSFGEALRSAPAWLVILFMLFINAYAFVSLILPDISNRTWSIPEPRDLIHVNGHFTGYRLDTRTPYNFITDDGKNIILTCAPWATKWNDCLARAGLDYNQITNKPVSLTYFKATTLFDVKKILIGMSGGVFLSDELQMRSLQISAKLQDQGDSIGLLFGIPIATFALLVILAKIIWYRR